MPLLGVQGSALGNRGVFVRAQLPFLVALAYVVAVIAVIDSGCLGRPPVLWGVVLGMAATVLSLLVPWARVSARWMILIPMIDVVAIACISAEVHTVFPAAAVLALLPILWIAFVATATAPAAGGGILLVVFCAACIPAFRLLWTKQLPRGAAEWADAVTLPFAFVGLAVIASVAARRLRRHVEREARAHAAQGLAVARAHDAETLLRGVLDTVDAGVAFFDAEGRLEIANATAHRMAQTVGFRLDEPPYAGEHVTGADRTVPTPFDEQLVPRALRGQVIRGHLAWLGPPGAQVATLSSTTPLRRADGSVRGTVIVAHDVTELVEAVEVREHFLRTASHELRTPLTGVMGFLSLINDALDPGDTKVRRYMEVVMRRADDLLRRISDLVVATDDDRPLRLDDLDLREAVDGAVRRVGAFAAARGNEIDVGSTVLVPVRADRARVEAAVAEVLTNAVKFGRPGARITVECASAGDHARVTVSNEGAGLTPAEQRRVFDRFYRTAHARANAIQGYGIGLFTVRSIVAAHRGRVSIDSAPGAGVAFTLELPVAGPLGAQPTAESVTHRA